MKLILLGDNEIRNPRAVQKSVDNIVKAYAREYVVDEALVSLTYRDGDMVCARSVLDAGIPMVAYVMEKHQIDKWAPRERAEYEKLVSQADRTSIAGVWIAVKRADVAIVISDKRSRRGAIPRTIALLRRFRKPTYVVDSYTGKVELKGKLNAKVRHV